MRKSVVLPEPLGPTSPTFSPGFSWKEASTKMSCRPYCLLMLEKEIKGKFQASRTGGLKMKPASGAFRDARRRRRHRRPERSGIPKQLVQKLALLQPGR